MRGYSEDSVINGARLAGAPVMLEEVQSGANTMCF
jgi:hypothetical protein